MCNEREEQLLDIKREVSTMIAETKEEALRFRVATNKHMSQMQEQLNRLNKLTRRVRRKRNREGN